MAAECLPQKSYRGCPISSLIHLPGREMKSYPAYPGGLFLTSCDPGSSYFTKPGVVFGSISQINGIKNQRASTIRSTEIIFKKNPARAI